MMSEQTAPRYRINAKQTAKGFWYLDATAELSSPDEAADALLKMIQKTEKMFTKDGRILVGVEN